VSRVGASLQLATGTRLPDACRAYDIEGWENIDKGDIAKAIVYSRPRASNTHSEKRTTTAEKISSRSRRSTDPPSVSCRSRGGSISHAIRPL
jgi:hypothetical protein